MNKQRGFTLIELLIVVAIVAILAKVALPMYGSYMVRGKVVEAQSVLTSARVAMEQFYQDNRTYVGGPCPGATTYFTYACALATNTFTITASSRNDSGQGLGATGSYTYTINDRNAKTTTKFANTTSTATCWATKPGQSC